MCTPTGRTEGHRSCRWPGPRRLWDTSTWPSATTRRRWASPEVCLPRSWRKKSDAIAAANEDLQGITVLAGTEVDIKADGKLDYPNDLLARCDVVVASVHMGPAAKTRGRSRAALISAIENEFVHIIGHPTGRIINQREPYEVDMNAVLQAAARTGTALEINAYPSRLDLNETWAREAKGEWHPPVHQLRCA